MDSQNNPKLAGFRAGTPADLPAQDLRAALTIAAVERDTGLGKDTLRVWERRYGFPAPLRDALGERLYPVDQVHRLRVVKKLLDAGHRPGRIVALPLARLQALAEESAATAPDAGAQGKPDLGEPLALIAGNDWPALRRWLSLALSTRGVADFIAGVVGPLNVAIGDAWLRGHLEVFQEHLYTEALQTVLRQAIAGLPTSAGATPRVLLATLPGEPHALGLLMAEAMLALQGCHCLSLGVQTPLPDLVRAVAACDAHVLALSFSGCMSPNTVVESLQELRLKLPAEVRIWAGGSAPVLQRRPLAGVTALATLGDLPAALQPWREATRSR